MYIRKKANKGGSYSILLLTGERVPGKKHVVSRMIKNFGAATTDAELATLMQQAESYRAQLQACAPKKIKPLKLNADIDLASCRSYCLGFLDVYGHLFQDVFSELPFTPKVMKQLSELVVMRIAQPQSKRKTAAQACDYGLTLNLNGIYRLMDRFNPAIVDAVKKSIYQYTTQLLAECQKPLDVLFYDLTTIYFETNAQDELRDFGFSKDGKHQHVQIMLAVIVTHDGLLIDYEAFPGSCYEGHTLLPVIEKIKSRYGINKIVLVADSALMNKINLKELTLKNIRYVIAARIKNLKETNKQEVLDIDSYQNIYTSRDEKGVIHDEIKTKKITLETGDALVAYHSSKRARKDEYDRHKNIEKIKKYIDSTAKSNLTSRLRKPYVKISKTCKIEIDLNKLELDQRYDGYFGLQTNIEDAEPRELLSTYRGLWQVEQTFRIAKSYLEIRPVYHYTPRRIEAHMTLCYMALALVRYAEFILKKNNFPLPVEQLHSLLENIRVIRIKDRSDNIFEILQDHPPELKKLYQIFHIHWRKKFTHLTHLL